MELNGHFKKIFLKKQRESTDESFGFIILEKIVKNFQKKVLTNNYLLIYNKNGQ